MVFYVYSDSDENEPCLTFTLFSALLTELSSPSWLEDHNRKFGLFINNAWQHPDGRKTYETRSPATGAVLAATTQGTAEDVDTAVEAASQALASWSSLTGFQRAKHIYSIARHVQKHARSEHTLFQIKMVTITELTPRPVQAGGRGGGA